MTRALKGYEERKSEMVAAAWQLFSQNGYDRTTVNAIIEKLGVSKGTFYHYFASKEDILNAVVQNLAREGLKAVMPIFKDETLSAIEKLNRFIRASRAWRLAQIDAIMEIMEVLYRDENIIIRQKLHMYSLERVVPWLTQVIEQGIEEGIFDNPFPEECAELLLHISNVIGEANARLFLTSNDNNKSLEKIKRRIELYIDTMERILGAPNGTVEPFDKTIIEKIIDAGEKKGKNGRST